MFLWLIYIFSSLFISYILSTCFSAKFRTIILFFSLALLLTPKNLGIGLEVSSVLFSFILDLIFEQSVSVKTLRPLLLTLPLALILSFLVIGIRKRFSQS